MEYIPGYTTLRNIFRKGPYELFADVNASPWSFIGSNTAFASNAIDEKKIPTWSSTINYVKGNTVKMGGVIYSSVKDSLDISPILSMNGDYISVNSEFWKYVQLSPAVKIFNPSTDGSNRYFLHTIVNFNDILYECTNTSNQCKTDFTANEWKKLTSAIVENPVVPTVTPSYTDSLKGMLHEFSIEDIPDETWSDKLTRIFYIVYPYARSIITFFLALIIAAYSANDLLHKPALFRVLAFVYIFYFLYPLGAFSPLILSYYFYRCFLGPYIWPDEVFAPLFKAFIPIWEDKNYNENAMFPTLFTYPATADMHEFIRMGQEEFNRDRLASHGDVKLLLAHALHLKKPAVGMAAELATKKQVHNQPQPVQNQPQPVQNQPQPVQNQPQPSQNEVKLQPVQNQPQPVQNEVKLQPVQNEVKLQPVQNQVQPVQNKGKV
jgi:hypothetical protein